MSDNKSGFWSFFSSVKLTISLLAIIAVVSVIGTIVPQQEGAREFTRQMSPGLVSFLQTMQVFDLFHSVWFFLLMGLLSLNLIVCSLTRFPSAWRRFRVKPVSAAETDAFKGLSQERMIRTKADTTAVIGTVHAELKRGVRRILKEETDKGVFFYGDKGRIAHLGVYIVHLSLLLLVAGAVCGSLFGIEGYVNISEGETVNTIDLRNGKGTRALPFSIRCDRFTIDFYENGAPKTYRSDLTFLKNDRVALQGAVLVNHPISFEGIRFYQSSYGQAPEGKASLSYLKNGKKGPDMSVAAGDVYDLPGGDGKIHILRVEENLMQMGPAIKLSIRGAKGESTFWVFREIAKIKEFNPGIMEQVPLFNAALFSPYVFVMNGMAEKYYTGLQVSQDPGVPLVAAAAFLMVAGLILVYFSSHRQIWIRIDEDKSCRRISIAGRSYKDPVGLEREINRLLGGIRERAGAEE
ncbi:MAG: Cytochrome c biogenesis protein Ccs1 [Syntrophus sp. SKADARSKE-3]|nr:Cytochrome c biogenesis protein Ccs1 [Syntrophus sp. SKADARSKE-3]